MTDLIYQLSIAQWASQTVIMCWTWHQCHQGGGWITRESWEEWVRFSKIKMAPTCSQVYLRKRLVRKQGGGWLREESRKGIQEFDHFILGVFAHNVGNYQLRLDMSQYFLGGSFSLNFMVSKKISKFPTVAKELSIQLFWQAGNNHLERCFHKHKLRDIVAHPCFTPQKLCVLNGIG